MNVSMKKMIGLFAIAVVLVFIEGMFPEKKRTKALPYRYHTKAMNQPWKISREPLLVLFRVQ